MLNTQNHLVHLKKKKKRNPDLDVLVPKNQVQREDSPVCQEYLVRRELAGISCVFPEVGL